MAMNRRDFLLQGTALAGLVSAEWVMPRAAHSAVPVAPPQGTAPMHDLRDAVIFAPGPLTPRYQKILQMLVEEVEKRTEIRLPVVTSWSSTAVAVIVLLGPGHDQGQLPIPSHMPRTKPGPEGYSLHCASANSRFIVTVSSADERGLLFGVGGLLRQMAMTRGHILIPENLDVMTQPQYRLRGHQLGYRNLNNTCDGWSPELFEQYIRDLAVFGANAVEFIPPYPADNEWDSPNFTLPPEEMLTATSRICDAYGLDVWFWYPALARDYADPATVTADLKTWGDIFARVPRLDAVFVPGGDPGHTPPELLLPLLEKQTANLHRWHPQAQMWVSPQGFDKEWMSTFLNWIRDKRPAWLTGVVYGPGIHVGIHELRQQLPEQYPIRFYPDITHSLSCQYPVPDWDVAYGLTEGREVINPRPLGYANIFRRQMPETIGFLAYSEGVNDDFNKMLFSALGWDPQSDPAAFARDYSHYFIGPDFAKDFAEVQLRLERNWEGPLASNPNVEATYEQARALEQRAMPHDFLNWRFLMGLYRAFLDAYVRRRLIHETTQEQRARTSLQQALTSGGTVQKALDDAEAILTEKAPVAPELRTHLFELGASLFDTIRLQLSTEHYRAKNITRGATLDTMDAPLSNAPWLLQQLARIRTLSDQSAQSKALRALLNRTDPGPGGFYDDLGNITRQPHLLKGRGGEQDPEFRHSALCAFAFPEVHAEATPFAWKSWAASLYDEPLQMQYEKLDRNAHYRVRVVYAGNPRFRIALFAKNIGIHPYIERPHPPQPLEFDIPPAATADGRLTLTWHAEEGPGGNSRGCQVAEVWLLKKSGEQEGT